MGYALTDTAEELSGRARQRMLGQFFTPIHVADFMASLFKKLPGSIRLLDAGAGSGALTSAFVRHVCAAPLGIQKIAVEAWEKDVTVFQRLDATLCACKVECKRRDIEFHYLIRPGDFIREMTEALAAGPLLKPPVFFDAAIVNPPFRKIGANSDERRALRTVGIETSNLYAGFIALLLRLLQPGGQLVGITPRSFCNGPYFRPFRLEFLRLSALHQLHVFDSRRSAFRSDRVLQENIIFHVVRGQRQPCKVKVSTSSGEPLATVSSKMVRFDTLVHPQDTEQFIHIPTAPRQTAAQTELSKLGASLPALGMSVSTGPVVDFRLRDALRQMPEANTVPLLYPGHFNGGTVQWPKPGGRKPNAILDSAQTRPWLVPGGLYVLTKRFTAKEERRRVVACLFDSNAVSAERVGFENHLNYFHSSGRGLDRNLALGLLAYLNSTLVDQYFRRFSGHTQVNATDLLKLSYPDRATLEAIGREMRQTDYSQHQIDRLVERHLHGSP